jgi:hypothetical protein
MSDIVNGDNEFDVRVLATMDMGMLRDAFRVYSDAKETYEKTEEESHRAGNARRDYRPVISADEDLAKFMDTANALENAKNEAIKKCASDGAALTTAKNELYRLLASLECNVWVRVPSGYVRTDGYGGIECVLDDELLKILEERRWN